MLLINDVNVASKLFDIEQECKTYHWGAIGHCNDSSGTIFEADVIKTDFKSFWPWSVVIDI